MTWERARTTNVALDATLFDGKLSVTVDYFRTLRNDILIRRNVSVPDYTGLVLPSENLGRLTNRGFDFQITHNNTLWSGSRNPVNLSVGTNFTFARNSVKFLDEIPGLPEYQRQTGQSISDPAYGGLLYNSLGIFSSQFDVDAYPHVLGAGPGDIKLEDVNGDGAIDANDRIRPRYDNIPEIVYGVPINLSWRGLDLNILVQGQAHVAQYLLLESGSTGNFFAPDAANRWQPDNPNGTFPRVASKMLNSVNGVCQKYVLAEKRGFHPAQERAVGLQPAQNAVRQGQDSVAAHLPQRFQPADVRQTQKHRPRRRLRPGLVLPATKIVQHWPQCPILIAP